MARCGAAAVPPLADRRAAVGAIDGHDLSRPDQPARAPDFSRRARALVRVARRATDSAGRAGRDVLRRLHLGARVMTHAEMIAAPRVALFTDSYHEANGVARTASALEAFVADRDLPLLIVHGGRSTQLVETGSVQRLELRRSPLSFDLEHDLRFDLALWRHAARVTEVVRDFAPDVLHFTGP